MITKSLRGFTALTLSLGLMSTLTATPTFASRVDPVPSARLAATLPADAPGAGLEMARRGRGADDAQGGHRGGGRGRGRGADDGPNHGWMNDGGHDDLLFARRGRGADDAQGGHRGGGRGRGRGADDGPNHG